MACWNAIGSINLKPLARLTADEVTADFRLNALSAFLALQAHAAAPKARRGEAA